MKKKDDARAKIIQNALKIFTKKGFFRATMEDIARASGIAKGTVYLYFKDKSSLYIAVIQDYYLAAISYLEELEKEELPSMRKLQKIADDWVDYMIRMKSSFFMFSMENLNLSSRIIKAVQPIVTDNLRRMIDHIARIIDQGIKTGEFRKVDIRIAAFHFLNTIRTCFYIAMFAPEITQGKKTSLQLYFEGLKTRR